MDDNLFEKPVDRREMLKKVAVYTPPIVLAGRALIGASTAAAATEVESSLSTSLEGGGGGQESSSGSAAPPVNTPLESLEGDLALLVAIPATGQRAVDKNVAEAVGDLTEATNTSQWSDGYTLTAEAGDNVFNYLKWGADALNTSGSPSGDVATALADVVTQAGTIANTAVTSATLTAKVLKKAQAKLALGAQRAANGNVRGAIAAYMHAWDFAVTGVEAADPDDAN